VGAMSVVGGGPVGARVVGLLCVAVLAIGCGDDLEPRDTVLDYRWEDGPWLTWHSDPATAVTISWLTGARSRGCVRFGSEPDALDARACEGNDDDTLHRVALEGLEPDTTVYYAIENTLEGSAGPFSFRTAPSTARTLRFGVVGDMQPDRPDLVESNVYMAERLAEVDVDFWVQVGDIAHTGGSNESWHRLMESLPLFAAEAPLLAVLGNHDTWGDGGRNWARLFPHAFAHGATGENEDASTGRYYSLDVLDVHLVVLDNFDGARAGETTPMSSAQIDWLEQDLAAARAADRWIFVFFHLSILSTGSQNMDFELQKQLVPIFARHGVDGVFYGHDHMYEHYLYAYGDDGLLHDPDDATTALHPVHYWLTGGGGAELESGYGILDRGVSQLERTWYDAASDVWRAVPVEIRAWDPTYAVDDVPSAFSPGGANVVHDCRVACYQSDAAHYGHDYGENTLHYMIVEVSDATATVSAHYPDGALIDGPDGTQPQTWTLRRGPDP